eukprot:COSAG02_NODE_2202_length_9534_cov_20.277160_4_plen_88_part_00
MQVTEDDDPESRGRLAPHEVPLVMAALAATHRRLRRCQNALDTSGASDQRLIQKVARAKKAQRLLRLSMIARRIFSQLSGPGFFMRR